MKTQGEIESAICEGISRFEQDYMGRGRKDIRTHLIETARPVMEIVVSVSVASFATTTALLHDDSVTQAHYIRPSVRSRSKHSPPWSVVSAESQAMPAESRLP